MIRRSEHRAWGMCGKTMALWALLAPLWFSAGSLEAEQFGLFTYEVFYEIVGEEIVGMVEITDYPTTGVGEVDIPTKIDGMPVTSIGIQAFSRCSGLTSVSIPDSVTEIRTSAFYNCSGLTSISIPDSVTEFGYNPFSGCTGLTSVSIGSGLTSMTGDINVFSTCSVLNTIEVDTGNSTYSSLDGVLFDYDRTTLIIFPSGKTGAYSIPNSVTEIGASAFSGCSGLTALTIGSGLTSIATNEIPSCAGLTTFEVDSLNSAYSSLDGVLFDYNRTALIRFPRGKTGAYSIPASVTEIGASAFSNCTALNSVTIPEGVISISSDAFNFCSGLTTIEVDALSSVFSHLDGVLFDYDRTALVRFPAGKTGAYSIPDGVTEIGASAFFSCSGLTSVSLPDSVTSIGDRAFSYCRGLTSVSLPDSVTSIGYGAFGSCSGLTSVSLPGGVTSIGDSAFAACSGLTSVSLPDSVASIGVWAFRACTGLTSITIPGSVTSIRREAFRDCSGLTSVSIGSGVTSIGDSAFSYCSLTSVTIPDSVTEIGSGAFAYRYGSGLNAIVFLGDAPSVTQQAWGRPTIFYLRGSSGFTSAWLRGSPAIMLDGAPPPPDGLWLLTHGLPAEVDLHTDLNGDGVTLLMAYALNLNPNLNLRRQLPRPIRTHDDGALRINFFAAAVGITYTVQTSTDLKSWTTEGVTLSDFSGGGSGKRWASVALDGAKRYMRLVVSE